MTVKGICFVLKLLFCYVKEINLNKTISFPTTLCLLMILNDTFLSMSYMLLVTSQRNKVKFSIDIFLNIIMAYNTYIYIYIKKTDTSYCFK